MHQARMQGNPLIKIYFGRLNHGLSVSGPGEQLNLVALREHDHGLAGHFSSFDLLPTDRASCNNYVIMLLHMVIA